MKFLIDAQLPPSLKNLFIAKEFDCLHTLDLDLKNETPDSVINFISINEQRVVITKDNDFFNSFILKQQPHKLILEKLGNISKNELVNFFAERLDSIIEKNIVRKNDFIKKRLKQFYNYKILPLNFAA